MESITTPHLNEITATKKRNRPGQKQRAKEKKKLRLDNESSGLSGQMIVESGTINHSRLYQRFRKQLKSITLSSAMSDSVGPKQGPNLARTLLKEELLGYNQVDENSVSIETDRFLLMEESRIINVVISALLNPVYLSFDVNMFIERASKPAFRNYIPEQTEVVLNEPAVILDIHGRILLWNLPHIFSKSRVISINQAVTLLADPLQKSLSGGSKKKTWRDDIDQFAPGPVLKGVLDLSPGWFAQAQDNNSKSIFVSTDLRSDQSVDTFLEALFRAEELTNAINFLIAPELHNGGLESLRKLMTLPEPIPTYVQKWPSVASGMAIIVNRLTPPHRDQNGMNTCYDLLMTAGDYTDCYLDLDELNMKVQYLPGSIVALCGKPFRHGVDKWDGGDRICIAHFFRRNVFYRMKTKTPEYVEYSCFSQLMDTNYTKQL